LSTVILIELTAKTQFWPEQIFCVRITGILHFGIAKGINVLLIGQK
jgi:hypothetical protein